MSEHSHLTRSQYEELIRGQLPPRRLIHRLFQHLLERCPTCREEWRAYCADRRHHPGALDLEREVTGSDDSDPFPEGGLSTTAPPEEAETARAQGSWDETLDRAVSRIGRLRRRIEKDRAKAPELLRQLLSLEGLEARVTRVRRSDRYRNWALCDLLLAKSREAAFLDPDQSEKLCQLALETTAVLEPARYQEPIHHDLLARGWAYLANTRRIRSRLNAADEALLMARYFLDQGSGDPLVAGEVLSLEASLRRGQRRFEQALDLLSYANRLYEVAGESQLQGRILLKRSTVLGELGRIDEAIAASDTALELIDADREPYQHLCARHSYVHLLHLAGRDAEARTALEEIRPLYRRFRQPLTELRLTWLEAEIAEGLGELDDAEAGYEEVRRGFIEHQVPYDAALVSLCLAGLYRRQGRYGELRELAQEMLVTFPELEVHREILATWKVLCDAAVAEQVSVRLLGRLADHFRRARRLPALKFEEETS